jgi:hypothetical protein
MVIGRQIGLLAWPFAAGGVVMGLLAWRLFETDGAERSLLRAAAAAFLASVAIFGIVLPSLNALFPSATLARMIRDANCSHPQFASAGYHEPSLVFLMGTSTRLTNGAGAADFLRGNDCRFALVEARHERMFLRRAEAIGLRYAAGPRIEGINYSIGRPVTIAIYRSEPAL